MLRKINSHISLAEINNQKLLYRNSNLLYKSKTNGTPYFPKVKEKETGEGE